MQSANTYCPQKNPGPNIDAVTRRTSSVRRNFVTKSDRSPKQSPLATLLPTKETCEPKPTSHTRLLGCECPSALSFLLAKSSHLGQRKRIATALPRAKNRFCNSPMNAFASKSAGASAPVLIEPRSPTTARQCREIFRTTVRLPKSAHVVRFVQEAASRLLIYQISRRVSQTRVPQWFLR